MRESLLTAEQMANVLGVPRSWLYEQSRAPSHGKPRTLVATGARRSMPGYMVRPWVHEGRPAGHRAGGGHRRASRYWTYEPSRKGWIPIVILGRDLRSVQDAAEARERWIEARWLPAPFFLPKCEAVAGNEQRDAGPRDRSR